MCDREYLDTLNYAVSLLLTMHVIERPEEDSIKSSLMQHLKNLGDVKRQRGDK